MIRTLAISAFMIMLSLSQAWGQQPLSGEVKVRGEPRSTVSVQELPESIRRRAMDLLSEAREEFPRWTNARLGSSAYPLYRPDIEEVAYFEVPVVRGAEDSATGFILLSAGRHDFPIVSWATEGESNVARLRREAERFGKQPHKTYLLAPLLLAAEDKEGNPITEIGLPSMIGDRRDWQQVKDNYARTHGKHLESLRQSAAEQWQAIERGSDRVACDSWQYDYAGNAHQQRRYVQLRSGEWPNNTRCYSGCNATAWAMLFGWHNICDWGQCPRWHDRGHGTETRNLDPNVSEMIWEIRGYLRSKCYWPISESSTGLIYNGPKVAEYLAVRGGADTVGTVSVSYNPLGTSTGRLRNEARSAIRDGRPVVYQLGWDHKVVAYGVRSRTCGANENLEFLINQGAGTESDRWTSGGTAVVGMWLPPRSGPSSIAVCPPHADCAFDEVCTEPDMETGRCYLCKPCSAYAGRGEEHAN